MTTGKKVWICVKIVLTVTLICAFVVTCVVSTKEESRKKVTYNYKVESGIPVSRITHRPEHCYDGYLYVEFAGGSHSGIAGVAAKAGPEGFVKC